MRVAFLSWRDLAHPQAGGSEVVVHRLAEGLQARGHDVTLVSAGPVESRTYRVVRNGGTYTQYFRAPFTMLARVRRPDVIVDVENGIPFFTPMWRRQPVVCLVHHVHTDQWAMQFSKAPARLGRWLESRLMPRAYRREHFVAVSQSTAQDVAGLGVTPERITTIEMGCEAIPRTTQRDPSPRFLVLGRLVPHKRVELALAMWERVRPHTGGRLVIAGDGPELERLRRLAGSDVEFTGHVDPTAKAKEISAAWLLVHPAHHEGWGTVVMEAASAGLPTVAFDVRGVRDSIVNGSTGVLAQDEDDFVEQWIDLATNEPRRRALSEAAQARAATFTWDRSIDAFEQVLLRAADRTS